MKKLFLFIVLLIFVNSSFPQAYTDAWRLGFGLTIPRYIATDIAGGEEGNYGGHFSVQRDFSEHFSFRLKAIYQHMSPIYNPITCDLIGGGFDALYYFVPCEPITPYIGAGITGYSFTLSHVGENGTVIVPGRIENKTYMDYQANFLFGVSWTLNEDWQIKTELGYHTVANDRIDGTYGPSWGGGMLGGNIDSYLAFELGALYYIDKGEKSKYCELYTGITAKQQDNIDYNKIEKIVEKYSNKPVDIDYKKIEDIVSKYANKEVAVKDKWVLIGVNFEFGKASLMPESFPILVDAAQVLLTNPTVKVEIQGHTDNVGSTEFNKKLSLQRSETVKRFLIAKGVEASRLTTSGLGESQPISGNDTPDGRLLNRRIEFKVLSK